MTSTTSVVSADQVFGIVDAADPEAFARLFTPDGRLTFGNGPAMVGHEAIIGGCTYFYTTITGLTHQILHEWNVGDDHVVELVVTYTRLDGGTVDVPCVSIWATDAQGLITDYRVFFDLAPVYA